MRAAWVFTQSSTVTIGKSEPHRFFVLGLILMEPLDPWQPPKLFTPMTKKRSVSRGLPGPIRLSHQPGYLSSFL